MATATRKFTPEANVYILNGKLTLTPSANAVKIASCGSILNYDDAEKAGLVKFFEKAPATPVPAPVPTDTASASTSPSK